MCRGFFRYGLALVSFGVGVIFSLLFQSVLLAVAIGAGAIVIGLILMKKN